MIRREESAVLLLFLLLPHESSLGVRGGWQEQKGGKAVAWASQGWLSAWAQLLPHLLWAAFPSGGLGCECLFVWGSFLFVWHLPTVTVRD